MNDFDDIEDAPIEAGSSVYQQIQKSLYGEKPQIARFLDQAKLDIEATERQGHAVYVDLPYVTIRNSGAKDSICILATNEHKLKFRKEWKEYVSRKKVAMGFSDIIHLPTITLSVVQGLKEMGIHTIEVLAKAPIKDRIETKSVIKMLDSLKDVTKNIEEEPVEEVEEVEEEFIPAIPTYMAKWKTVAQHYLTLKQFAINGEKPRIKLEYAA